jgi:tRNA threonylcarbamoyladenosine biosynthesis protein TsaE
MTKTVQVAKEKLPKLAEWFLSHILKRVSEQGATVALYGDLGAGKTAFVKEVAKLLGIEETVISPTFILKKEYDIDLLEVTKLIHVDAYRFLDKKEGDILRLDEDMQKGNLLFIEWPEKIEKRDFDAEILFTYVNETVREVTFTLHDDKKK